MGFVVLPALPADISPVYDVYFAAFKNNAITRALFPSATALLGELNTRPRTTYLAGLAPATKEG